MREGDSETEVSALSLSFSLSIIFLVFILMSSALNSIMFKPLLYDGSVIVHGRYMITFDALETVKHDDGKSVVAIGSSITRASIDGSCIENHSLTPEIQVYNLGLSAGNPYTEMMQLTALIEAKPDIVMLEAGVNSFWDIDSQKRTGGIDENSYIEYRMRLNSMNMDTADFGNWTDLIREEDKQFLYMDDMSQSKERSKFTNEAVEEVLRRLILNSSNAPPSNSWLRAPLPTDNSWEDYLSTPNYRVGVWNNGSPIRDWDTWFEENMESYSTYGEFNPQHSGTLFHTVLGHVVEELENSGITVILIAAPRNPMVFDYLEPGQTDGLNSSLNNLSISDKTIVENMFWDPWERDDFLDRNHLNGVGREKMCHILVPKLDYILQ